MQRPAKPFTPVRFRPRPFVLEQQQQEAIEVKDEYYQFFVNAWVAKLVDARDLKSLGIIFRAGSTPAPGTTLGST